MRISQNVLFEGDAPTDIEFDHPPGASIARLLQEQLRDRDWFVKDLDIWRDSGWSLQCSKENSQMQISIAIYRGEWMLQVSPEYQPGLIARLCGRLSSASADDVFELAKDIHEILFKLGTYTGFKWQWNAFPSAESATNEPKTLPEVTR